MAPQLVFPQRLPLIAGAAAGRAGRRGPGRQGFTLVELAVVGAVSVVVAMLLLPLLAPRYEGRRSAPRVKDASQVAGILQSLVIWAGSNADQMPLPSLLDGEDATVPHNGPVKDTTGAVLSLLIYNGLFPVELTVSPGEAGNVRRDRDYQTVMPNAAVNPARALWDPGFSADFTGPRPGNTSYATMSLNGARRDRWKLHEFSGTEVLLGSRGPQVTGVTMSADGPSAALANLRSKTLRFFGEPDRWEGNVAYEDIHVEYERSMAPDGLLYRLSSGAQQRDTLFYDEPDDATGDNDYLTITIPAAGVAGGRPIWD